MWNPQSVVSGWVQGWRLWRGEVQVSNWVKFGRRLRAVVKGIAGGKELGFRSVAVGFRWCFRAV